MKSTMRIKLKEKDIDYKRYISASKIVEVFDDIAEELFIRNKGHRGVLKEYEKLEFIKPLVCGDYLDIIGQIIAFNETTLKIKFEVLKVLDGVQEKYLLKPELLCKAIGIFEVFQK